MCVSLFSITAHAEQVTVSDLEFEMWTNLFTADGGEYFTEFYTSSATETLNVDAVTGRHTIEKHIYVYPFEGVLMVKHEELCELSINEIYYSSLAYNGNSYQYFRNPTSIKALVYYDNGATEYFDVTEFDISGPSLNCKFEFAPDRNVDAVELIITESFDYAFPGGDKSYIEFYFNTQANNPTFIMVDQPTKTEGLLAGIFQKVKDGFQNLKDGLNNVVKSITELPEKIWVNISDGLKGLFVPSEESMTLYKDKWDELLASRFGAVYQVVNIMTDSWDGIMQADETDTIAFPQATINFSGTPFTFGGYDVKIVPDGFGVLVTAIKSIVAIVCTVAFVNGLRKRYDEIMGVEQ